MPDRIRFFANCVIALSIAGSVAAPTVAQEWATDPNSVVYAIYDNYRPDGQAMAAPGFVNFLTPETRTLFERELKNTDEATALDADPFCDCQDWGTITVQSVLLTFEAEDRAKAVVWIADTIDARKPRSIVFRLHRTPAGWRVHDAGPESGWSLRSVIDRTPKGPTNGR